MGIYGHTLDGRMREAFEQVGEIVLSEEKRAATVLQLAGVTEREIATPLKTESCDSYKVAPAVGLEPELSPQALLTIPLQKHHKSLQYPHRTMT